MKSMTKKISLLLLLSVTLFLSSCLDSGSGSWIGTQEFSYITEDGGTVYARTISGYLITSQKIQTLNPGSAAVISYQIDFDESEPITIGDDNKITIYQATLAGEPIILEQTTLRFSETPDVPPVHFESILTPTFAENEYFGDRWLFPYTVKLKKGETAKVNFYLVEEQEDITTNTVDEDLIIDVRITKTGQAKEGADEKTIGDHIVVNMSELRTKFANNDKLNIKIRYYSDHEKDKLYTSDKVYSMPMFKE